MAEEIQKDIKKGRDAGIDLIRVVACLVVIVTHVDVMGTGDSTKLFLRLLFADGVTLFFILSGFFFFRKGFIITLKRALSSIVLPGILVMLMSYQFSPFIRGEKTLIYCFSHLNFDIYGFMTDLFSWGGNIRESMAAHLWYIFTYLQLVLAYPLLKPLYTKSVYSTDAGVDKGFSEKLKNDPSGERRDKQAVFQGGQRGEVPKSSKRYNTVYNRVYRGDCFRKYRWFIIGFIFFNQILMDLNMTGLISFSPVQISPFMLYTAPAMLLMIGAEIKKLRDCFVTPEMAEIKKRIRLISLVVLIVTFASRFFLQQQVFILNSSQDFYLYWNCAFATVQSTAFVIFVLSFNYENNKPVNFIAGAGKYTFWIYLLHYGIYYTIFFRKGPDWSFGIIDLANGYDTLGKEVLHLLIRIPTVFLLSLLASYSIEKIKSFAGKIMKVRYKKT